MPVAEQQTIYGKPFQDRLVQVLVDCPGIDKLLTYAIPPELDLQEGDILTVPFAERYVGAIALQFPENSSNLEEFSGEIKTVHSVIGAGLFPPSYWQLLKKTANYYRTSLMQTVKAALPPKLLDQSSYRLRINTAVNSPNLSVQSELFANHLPSTTVLKLSTAAQLVWDFVQTHADADGSVSRKSLYQQLPRYAGSGIRSLVQMGYLTVCLEPPRRPQPKFEDVTVLLQIPEREITEKQREVLLTLQRLGGEVPRAELIRSAKSSYTALQTLVKKGCIFIDRRECLRLGGKSHFVARDRPKQLTAQQQKALEQIQALAAPNLQLLLHGVTGSGKTEVYLQAIAPILEAGKSALVLVPEIGLTPQLTDRFRARFGDAKINVYHSQLSDGERFDTWRQMLTGEPQIVIGTRSAIFAPLPQLGLIVLDEEHDPSFKQERMQPCYHARTLAQWRSQLESCPLILGSATPSLETLYATAKYASCSAAIPNNDTRGLPVAPHSPTVTHGIPLQYVSMPERIGNRPMPEITVVDMRQELQEGNWSIFSRQLQTAIASMVEQKRQGILFIHRRGYSTFVSCRTCGHVENCPHCDVSLAYHATSATSYQTQKITSTLQLGNLRCHYCNHSQSKPVQCPACGSPYFKHFGSGTQKVEQELAKLFPELRIIRFDSDTTRNKDQHRLLLEQFQNGQADLLVGTQMLTKGIDIPQVTLVGVVSADGLLNFSDYRAGERALQTLVQVAGRAGRGEEPGKVIVQTYAPEHAAIEALKDYTIDEFMETELSHRTALKYPPVGQLASIQLSSIDAIAVEQTAIQVAQYLQAEPIDWEILGPTPALITKVNNRYRWQILLKFDDVFPEQLPTLEQLRQWVKSPIVRVGIDVDPLNVI